jgi:hypothetical protein
VNLEEALERESRKIDPKSIVAVSVRSLDDIKRVLLEFDPKYVKYSQEIELSTYMNTVEDGKPNTYAVSAKTRSKTMREILIDGIDVVKRQIETTDEIATKLGSTEVNGVIMKPPKFGNNGESKFWIDPLIKQWMGGYRDKLLICWDIDGFQYRYDIYNHKLDRIKNEN